MLRVWNQLRASVPLLTLVIGATSSGAQAQGLVTTQKLSAALANELVGESVAECKKNGHAVVAVGYDDAQQVFIMRNSWGTGWGMQGYFTLPYAYLIDPHLASDFWQITLVA